jgi:hypothetical protein
MAPKEEITSNLENLKQEYNKFKKDYDLPEFTELNKLFDIEEIDTETEFLLRKIRRTIAEKVSGYLRFSEILLNPSNAPMFFFKLIKKLESSDKEALTKIYDKLGSFEIEMINIDLEYNEQKEAEFIKKCYESFKDEVKPSLLKVVEKLNNGNSNSKKASNDSYFG